MSLFSLNISSRRRSAPTYPWPEYILEFIEKNRIQYVPLFGWNRYDVLMCLTCVFESGFSVLQAVVPLSSRIFFLQTEYGYPFGRRNLAEKVIGEAHHVLIQ